MDRLEAAIDELFREWNSRDRPGCAVGIVEDGRLVAARGFGMADLEHDIPVTPTSIFHVASLSKQFTAFLIVYLAREGKLSLDDDVRGYLSDLPDFGRPITLRHLLHHTSGLRDQWTLLNLAGWREHDVVTNADVLGLAVRQRKLDFPVGDEYQYSNTGYTLLGLIVERVTGQSLRAFAQERIFGPLEMSDTHFHDDHTMIVPNRAYAYVPRESGGYRISIPAFDTVGPSSVFTTVEDLARWIQRFLDPKPEDDEINRILLTRGVLNNGSRLPYAGGLEVTAYRGLETVGHGGGDAGYRSHIIWFPSERFGVIILGNVSTLRPDTLARGVADIYLADHLAPVPPPPTEAALSPKDLAAKAGLYWSARIGKIRRLEYRDGALRLVMWPGYAPELIPIAPDRFLVPGESTEYAFTARDGSPTDLCEVSDGAGAEVFRHVTAVQPTAEQLAEYVGTFHSDEVGTTWTIQLKTDGLVANRPKFATEKVIPAFADGFLLDGWDPLVFHRDNRQEIDGFALSTYRLRHLFFRREVSEEV